MKNIIKKSVITATLLTLSGITFSGLEINLAQPNAKVYTIQPANIETMSSTFKLQFNLSSMGISPAGIEKSFTRHHHLIINGDFDKIPKNLPISTQITHFKDGQTKTTLNLIKGKQSLQLLLSDKFHIPHKPVVSSKKINIV